MKVTWVLGRVPTFRAFRYRSFRLLWFSAFLWSTGTWMQQLAMGWLMLKLTSGSASYTAATFAVRSLPYLLLGVFAGAVADRMSRKGLLILVHLASALVSFLTAALVAQGLIDPWLILTISFIYGALQTISMPPRQALVYDIVDKEDTMNALALNTMGMRFMSVVGALVAGLTMETIGIASSFLIMGVTYLPGIVALYLIPSLERGSLRDPESVFRKTVAGLRYIVTNQITATLLILAIAVETFAFSYRVVVPIFADTLLKVAASGYGYLTAASGVGALLGTLLLASLGNFHYKGWLIMGISLFFGLFLLGFSASSWFWLSLLLVMGVGMTSASFDAMQHILLQQNVPDQMRGTVLGAWLVSVGVGPVGMMYLGLAADWMGAPLALAINGAVVVVISLAVILALPRLRALR
ncbi:MAG: MFS transporter [Chloroflexi bacterium]|nr:MFS transporter [Chloroflexota bacterium]